MFQAFRATATALALLWVAGCSTTASIPEDRLRTALRQMDKPNFQHVNEQGLTPDGCGFVFLAQDVTWCHATWTSLPLKERMHFLLQSGSPVTLGILEAGRVEVLADALMEGHGSQRRVSPDEARKEIIALGDTLFQSCTLNANGRAEEDLCIFTLAPLASEVGTQRALATVARIEAEDARARKMLTQPHIPKLHRLSQPQFFRDATGKIRIKR